MRNRLVLAVVTVALALATGRAFAGEGNGNPFPFSAASQVADGRAVLADTGSSAYPEWTGNAAQPSSLAQLEPAFGSEAPIQTANSLPRGAGDDTVAYAQARRLFHALASQTVPARSREASLARPQG